MGKNDIHSALSQVEGMLAQRQQIDANMFRALLPHSDQIKGVKDTTVGILQCCADAMPNRQNEFTGLIREVNTMILHRDNAATIWAALGRANGIAKAEFRNVEEEIQNLKNTIEALTKENIEMKKKLSGIQSVR